MFPNEQAAALNEYVDRGNRDIPGWLWQSAAYVTALLGTHQVRAGLRGNLGEIGVWQGRYLYLLGLLSQADERVVGIDSFVHSPDPEGFARRVRERFEAEGSTRGKLTLITEDSTKLTPQRVQAAEPGEFRLFSIDGGHLAHEALSDLKLVAPMMTTGGIMVLDDILNHTCPGVIEGTLDFLKSPAGEPFAAFCLVGNKLLVCDKESAEGYRQYLRELIDRYPEVSLFRDCAYTLSTFPEGVYPRLCGSDLMVITWSGDYLINDKGHGNQGLLRMVEVGVEQAKQPEHQLPPVLSLFE